MPLHSVRSDHPVVVGSGSGLAVAERVMRAHESLEDRSRLLRYRELADAQEGVLFGRPGTYQHLDLHLVIAAAVHLVDDVLVPHLHDGEPLRALLAA